jgi:hypothetical protein
MWATTLRSMQTLLTCAGMMSSAPGLCKEYDASNLYRDFAHSDTSPVDSINNFRVRDFNSAERTVTVKKATLIVALLTPLNSKVHREGDAVRAVVVASSLGNGDEWLPKGTVLEGCVERTRAATYAKIDGSICLSFYSGHAGGQNFEINALPSTADSSIHPTAQKFTTKQKIRTALMAASFIAVPLSIGTGGISLAITAGAGAVIGGVLADDHKHITGAINGAWEGSGLGAFDPLVRKGRTVVLPEGTKFAMQLREPAQIPASIIKLAKDEQHKNLDNSVVLQTQATLLASKPADFASISTQCQKLIDQKDLASALALVDHSLQSWPDDKNLQELRQKLIQEVSGTQLPVAGI